MADEKGGVIRAARRNETEFMPRRSWHLLVLRTYPCDYTSRGADERIDPLKFVLRADPTFRDFLANIDRPRDTKIYIEHRNR